MLAYKLGSEFAQSNKGVVVKGKNKYYLDGKKIDKKFPDSYQFSSMIEKKSEQCSKCKFYLMTKTGEEYCASWDANTRAEYWCKKWQKNQSK